MTTAQSNTQIMTLTQSPNNERLVITMYRDKELNNTIIDFTTVDRNGRIVKMTPRLFVETACVIAHTDKYGLSKIIAASSSQYRKKHLELLDEKRLPSIKEFFSFCRLLNTFKADFERTFEMLVNKQIEPMFKGYCPDIISSNGTKESEVNKINIQFTWPKTWGEDIKDIGSAMDANFLPVFLGFIAAIISGYMAIKWMLDLIQNKSLDIFSYYCWAVGIIVFMGSIAHIF